MTTHLSLSSFPLQSPDWHFGALLSGRDNAIPGKHFAGLTRLFGSFCLPESQVSQPDSRPLVPVKNGRPHSLVASKVANKSMENSEKPWQRL